MKNSIVIFLFIVGLINSIKAFDKQDSVVNFSNLKFVTPQEKTLFDTSKITNNNYFFQLAIFSGSAKPQFEIAYYIQEFDSFINYLKDKGFENKKPEKKVKMIYEEVHTRFFKKYDSYSTFENIFIKGSYNCVTATIFYAIILEHFKIPYVVKESTSHVFLIANIEGKSISLETTDPQKGYMTYNDNFKQQFVDYLKKQKIVTNADIVEKGTNRVFEENYFEQQSIDLKKTIGLQYYNNGIFALNNDSLALSLINFQKSYYLYPCEKTKYLIFSCLVNLISKADYFKFPDWEQFVLLTYFTDSLISTDQMAGEFGRITQKVLIEKSNLLLYDSIFNIVSPKISEKHIELIKKIGFIYHSEVGRFCAISKNMERAAFHSEIAYKLQPENYQIQYLFLETLFNYLPSLQEDEAAKKLEKIYYSYNKLNDRSRIHAFLTLYYFDKAEKYFEMNDFTSGDTMLLKFENFYAQKEINYNMEYRIGEVYTLPATYFFKNRNKAKAMEYVFNTGSGKQSIEKVFANA